MGSVIKKRNCYLELLLLDIIVHFSFQRDIFNQLLIHAAINCKSKTYQRLARWVLLTVIVFWLL